MFFKPHKGILLVLVGYVKWSYERPPCALEQAARTDRVDVRSPKSVALPVDAIVM